VISRASSESSTTCTAWYDSKIKFPIIELTSFQRRLRQTLYYDYYYPDRSEEQKAEDIEHTRQLLVGHSNRSILTIARALCRISANIADVSSGFDILSLLLVGESTP
jgi:hypothetical protein